MRINDDYREWNAEQQIDDETSVHAFWKRALKVRKMHDVLIYGDFVMLLETHEQVFAYTRNYGSTSALVLLNFKEGKVEIDLGEVVGGVTGYTFALGNYENEAIGLEEKVTLRDYEGRVYVREALLD